MPSTAPELDRIRPIRWPAPYVPPPRAAPADAHLNLELQPNDRSIHHVRLMALSFVQLVVPDHNYASRLTVTCAELVDLARRLGDRTCGLELFVSPEDRSARVLLSAEADGPALRSVEAAVELANRGQPVEAYSAALASNAPDAELALGLARIRYEGQMAVRTRRAGRRLLIEASSTPA